MKVPLPLLFLLLMLLVIFAVYDILKQSYTVHSKANLSVAQAILEVTLTRANAGLNAVAYRMAAEDGVRAPGLQDTVLRGFNTGADDLASRLLVLPIDSGRLIVDGRLGHESLGAADLASLISQPAFSRLFAPRKGTNRLPDALFVFVNDDLFILSEPSPIERSDGAGTPAFLVVGLPAKAIVFDELDRYGVFGRDALTYYLEIRDELSGLANIAVSLRDRTYAQFHYGAVAQIVLLLVAFIIAVMIGRHIDEKNDALRRSRDTIAAREHEAQGLRQQAEKASEAKSQFIHNMSHELRTPLNAILGYAEVIGNETFGALAGPLERYRASADAIHNGGVRLLNSISQVLEYSSLLDAEGAARDETVDLAAILHELGSEFRARMEKRNITLRIEQGSKSPSICADSEMIRRLFRQLIANAIEYSDDNGHVAINLELTPDGRLDVAVRDHGKGMDPMLQNDAFEAFVQGESVYARQHQGMGLGLSLAQAYARHHGADIGIQSALGEGTVATVSFPSERLLVEEPRIA